MVLLFDIVGAGLVFQQTPRAVTLDPPSNVMLPPDEAVVWVMEVIFVVVNAGKPGLVLKFTSFPYEVPTSLVANALT